MADKKIPKATARRLPLYYRYLRFLYEAGKERVSSAKLSEAVKVDSATIRRDFRILVRWVKEDMGMT